MHSLPIVHPGCTSSALFAPSELHRVLPTDAATRDVHAEMSTDVLEGVFAMNATMTHIVRNGINVTALKETIDAVRANPAVGQTSWSVQSRWVGGTRSDHEVNGCTIGGRNVERRFTIRADEPIELCGTN